MSLEGISPHDNALYLRVGNRFALDSIVRFVGFRFQFGVADQIAPVLTNLLLDRSVSL